MCTFVMRPTFFLRQVVVGAPTLDLLASTQQDQEEAEHRYNMDCQSKSDMVVHCPAHEQHTVFSPGPYPCRSLYPII